jgi:hypothetical protein
MIAVPAWQLRGGGEGWFQLARPAAIKRGNGGYGAMAGRLVQVFGIEMSVE